MRTGSIDPTRNGRFRARLPRRAGKRQTLGIFDTYEEAKVELAAAVAVLDESFNDGESLQEWGKKCLTKREVLRLVQDFETDWSRWNIHVLPSPLARMSLRALRRRHIQDWYDALRVKISHSHATNTLNLVRVVLRMAVEADLLKENPAKDVRAPRPKKTEDDWHYIEPEMQIALLDKFPLPERHLVAFAMGAGLRAGEIAALRIADVKLDSDKPHVIVRYGGPPNEPTKTGKIREVPLFGMALTAIKAWLDALPSYLPKKTKKRPQEPNPHGLAFPRKRGTFRDPKHMLAWQDWNDARTAAGIPNFRWHDLRHTCASSLVSGWWGRSWTLEEVAGVLGHSSIATTQRYAKLAPSALQKAANEAHRQWPFLAHASLRKTRGSVGNLSELATGIEPVTAGLQTRSGTQCIPIPAELLGQLWADAERYTLAVAQEDPMAATLGLNLTEALLAFRDELEAAAPSPSTTLRGAS